MGVPYLRMFLKLTFFLFLFIWIRATWFRLRYAPLLRFGWGFLFPFALLWFLVTALVVALDLPRTYLLNLSALSFLLEDLLAHPVKGGAAFWVFLGFALAFAVLSEISPDRVPLERLRAER